MTLKRVTTKDGEVYFTDSETGGRINASSLSIDKSKKAFTNELMKSWISTALEIFGIIFFLISLGGGIALWDASTKKVETNYFGTSIDETVIDSTMRGLAVGGMISSVIVLLVCLGISRIIKQNIYIINNIELLKKSHST